MGPQTKEQITVLVVEGKVRKSLKKKNICMLVMKST